MLLSNRVSKLGRAIVENDSARNKKDGHTSRPTSVFCASIREECDIINNNRNLIKKIYILGVKDGKEI